MIYLKQEIQALEAEGAGQEGEKIRPQSTAGGAESNNFRRTLLKQMAELEEEIKLLQSKNTELQAQIASYRNRVDNTPLRSIELSKISRTYDITVRKYQDLLAKGLESQISENMEKKQKGEQFQVLDPASFPEKPVSPNRQRILLMGLLLGAALGFGLAYVSETFDTSFKKSEELDGFVSLPVLATLPAIPTRSSVLDRRRAQVALVSASVGILGAGVFFLRLFGPAFF
jgi:uncharacterized protein involved in exopolysaccharide biosynthesis